MNYVVCYYFALLNSNSLYNKKNKKLKYTLFILSILISILSMVLR